MSTLAKVIAIGGFYRLIEGTYGNFSDNFISTLIIVSILSMIVGNVMALRQVNVKRMLAYSGISHAGFMLMSLLAVPNGASNLLYYATAYSVAGIAAFAVIIAITKDKDNENIENFNGLGKSNPMMAIALTLSLLSMAGIPILAGFFGKVFLFGQMLEMGYTTLVIVAVINSIISVGYYFKLILAMFTKQATDEPTQFSSIYSIVAIIATIINLAIGLFPDLVLKLI